MAHTTPIDELARGIIARYAKALEVMVGRALERGCGILVEWDVDSSYWQMSLDPTQAAETIVERRVPRREMVSSGRLDNGRPWCLTSEPF